MQGSICTIMYSILLYNLYYIRVFYYITIGDTIIATFFSLQYTIYTLQYRCKKGKLY